MRPQPAGQQPATRDRLRAPSGAAALSFPRRSGSPASRGRWYQPACRTRTVVAAYRHLLAVVPLPPNGRRRGRQSRAQRGRQRHHERPAADRMGLGIQAAERSEVRDNVHVKVSTHRPPGQPRRRRDPRRPASGKTRRWMGDKEFPARSPGGLIVRSVGSVRRGVPEQVAEAESDGHWRVFP